MKKTLLIILVLALVVAGGFGGVYLFSEQVGLYQIERNQPSLVIEGRPTGLGIHKGVLTAKVADTGAGVGTVTVKVEQGAENTEVYNQTFEQRTPESTFSVEFLPQKPKLKAGEARVIIEVADKSFWKNKISEEFTLAVDYEAPRLEVLTVQHNGRESGTLLTFYSLADQDIARSGVEVDGAFFTGYPAQQLDPAFADRPNLYFSLFPIPLDFNTEGGEIVVVAEDKVGNRGKTSFYQKIKDLRFPEVDMRLPKSFFEASIRKLLANYHAFVGLPYEAKDPQEMSDEEIVTSFKLINENYRGELEKVLSKLAAASEPVRYWSGVFEKPMPSKPTASFGESRSYYLGDMAAGGSRHLGVDLAKTLQSPVHAANKGKVVFADDLGIYGNAVVLDHGFGLQTLYGHLSFIKVKVGDIVEKAEMLGRSGATGLAGGDHLHFEVRLHNQAVTPFEWLDPLWIKSHVDGQIAFVKGEGEAPVQSEE